MLFHLNSIKQLRIISRKYYLGPGTLANYVVMIIENENFTISCMLDDSESYLRPNKFLPYYFYMTTGKSLSNRVRILLLIESEFFQTVSSCYRY